MHVCTPPALNWEFDLSLTIDRENALCPLPWTVISHCASVESSPGRKSITLSGLDCLPPLTSSSYWSISIRREGYVAINCTYCWHKNPRVICFLLLEQKMNLNLLLGLEKLWFFPIIWHFICLINNIWQWQKSSLVGANRTAIKHKSDINPDTVCLLWVFFYHSFWGVHRKTDLTGTSSSPRMSLFICARSKRKDWGQFYAMLL